MIQGKVVVPIIVAWLSLLSFGHSAKANPCDGLPAAAITALPLPLATWGKLVCTPYGQVLTSHDGWIWSDPGTYAPVFVPAQMVRDNPKPLGTSSYFTKIQLTRVHGAAFDAPYAVFEQGLGPAVADPTGYCLDVMSVSGQSMTLYFFNYGGSGWWGVWCPHGKCDVNSRFMLLDMTHKTN